MRGFNAQEKLVMEKLVEAHNAFCKLPVTHSEDSRAWCNKIHDLQYLLGARILRREHPEEFITESAEAEPTTKEAMYDKAKIYEYWNEWVCQECGKTQHSKTDRYHKSGVQVCESCFIKNIKEIPDDGRHLIR